MNEPPFRNSYSYFPLFYRLVGYRYLLSRYLPDGLPPFNKDEEKAEILEGGKEIMFLFGLTIIMAVISHQVLNLPAMWGMMFGLAILKLYVYYEPVETD